ncbi:NAD(P)/FAD-dependent oxidoreductase [Algoriphagus sp. D3-2-R+10]|uniref:NAD(P)/FAD-dependent oxidoreductase n=1 Tax=Algoriphagus aurantiacus TaxID=3103948 RepID=UPI002B3F04B5|nr:NAD(P)/FAD-dependent oxidoreductase [Algoriphagus sp. D3-2-R+10]MEB2774440.1 NAD(P)/FAD-dependent oxidoreductase [Algoriphagus sp. D3-2-R+10]
MDASKFDVIIIGGSYSGLSAALALGRSLRKVLVIDAGKPCNRQTPHSHNFLTQDGKTPAEISSIGRMQVEQYDTVTSLSGFAVDAKKTNSGFEIKTEDDKVFEGKKLILATGVKDIMPEIPGFAECWGISVIHCPYCHGYEVRNEKTGIFANGDFGYEFGKMITNWTNDLTLFTNGKSTLTVEQSEKLESKGVNILETEIESIEHKAGKLEHLNLKDGSIFSLKAMYAKAPFVQSSQIPSQLDLELTEQGLIQVDQFQKSTIPGVYACGDSTTMFRSVSQAVSSGTMAGAACNKELIDEAF